MNEKNKTTLFFTTCIIGSLCIGFCVGVWLNIQKNLVIVSKAALAQELRRVLDEEVPVQYVLD